MIRDRGIDVGFEPWDAGREIKVLGAPEPPTANKPAADSAAAAPAGEGT